jgi:hypothetical protein
LTDVDPALELVVDRHVIPFTPRKASNGWRRVNVAAAAFGPERKRRLADSAAGRRVAPLARAS